MRFSYFISEESFENKRFMLKKTGLKAEMTEKSAAFRLPENWQYWKAEI